MPRAPSARAARARARPRRVSADCEPARSTANSFSSTSSATSPTTSTSRLPAAYRQSTTSKRSLDRHPADRSADGAPGGRAAMLGSDHAEVGRLDAQRRVVRDHRCGCTLRLAERGADDAVVGNGRIEAMLDEAVLLDSVDLDLQRGRPDGHRLCERAPVAHAQLLDAAQRGARGTADVVGAVLQPVQLLDHSQRHHDVDVVKGCETVGIGDQHGRVEHDPRPHRVGDRLSGVDVDAWAGPPVQPLVDAAVGQGQEIGHRHSLSWLSSCRRLVVVCRGRARLVRASLV